MTGRHASATDVDDEALAAQPQEPGAHRAEAEEPAPSAKPPGRRATKKEPS
ncbi:MAG: hypothetical protein AB7K08_08805 [Microbacteriaceae bacterium]